MRRCLSFALIAISTLVGMRTRADPIVDFIPKYEWAQRPSAQDVLNAYPAAAHHLNVEGLVRLDCMIDAAGKLRDCQIVTENPKAFGFGKAALSLASRFVLKHPQQVRLAQRRIQIPIGFRLPPQV